MSETSPWVLMKASPPSGGFTQQAGVADDADSLDASSSMLWLASGSSSSGMNAQPWNSPRTAAKPSSLHCLAAVEWTVRELTGEETHALRRAVSADGRTDLVTMRHELDAAPGTWHLGATDGAGRVVAISSLYAMPCPHRPLAQPAFQLALMAVEPAVQRRGIGSAVMAEIIRRLQATDAVILWASARDEALAFYRRFGFETVEGSGVTPAQTGRPHHIIELDLRLRLRLR